MNSWVCQHSVIKFHPFLAQQETDWLYFMANTFWGFMIFVGFSVNHKPTTNHLTCNLMGNFMSLWWDNNLLILILMDILGILANSDRWSGAEDTP